MFNSEKLFFYFSLFVLLVTLALTVKLPEEKNIMVNIEVNETDINSLNDQRTPKHASIQYFENINFPSHSYLRHYSGRPLGFQKNFFLNLMANFEVSEEQDYDFAITSDDGYRLYIDNKIIAEFTTDRPAKEDKYNILLTKGAHKISIDYFQGFGNAALIVKYKPSNSKKYYHVGQNSSKVKFIKY